MTKEEFINALEHLSVENSIKIIDAYCREKNKDDEWINNFIPKLLQTRNIPFMNLYNPAVEQSIIYFKNKFNISEIRDVKTNQVIKILKD